MDGVLVRFGEIGIKSAPVRRQMLERLRQNLLDGLLREGVEGGVERRGARLWMTGPDEEALLRVATRTFGVVNASIVRECEATIDAIGEAAATLALARDWISFAVRASREGEHAFSSQDIAVQVGSRIYRAAEAAGRSPKVDLGAPDLELHVEVRGHRAYVFSNKSPGPGGLPMGSQGRVAAVLDRPAAQLATWLVMRRGAAVVPFGDPGTLASWGLTRPRESVSPMEDAIRLVHEGKVDALVTGERLDDLGQTPGIPVLRPVCGLADDEAARLAAIAGVPWP